MGEHAVSSRGAMIYFCGAALLLCVLVIGVALANAKQDPNDGAEL